MARWEYACLYLRDGPKRERWVLFSHVQDLSLLERLPCDRTRSTATELRADAAGTLELLGVLGEDGWELTGALHVDAVDADCLYLKRPLSGERRRYASQPIAGGALS